MSFVLPAVIVAIIIIVIIATIIIIFITSIIFLANFPLYIYYMSLLTTYMCWFNTLIQTNEVMYVLLIIIHVLTTANHGGKSDRGGKKRDTTGQSLATLHGGVSASKMIGCSLDKTLSTDTIFKMIDKRL